MKYSQLAYRYASAIFDVATSAKKQDEYLEGLRSVHNVLNENMQVKQMVSSPLIRSNDKEQMLKKALGSKGLPEDLLNFILLLAHKGRLMLLAEVIAAYQAKDDDLNKVTRGVVRSFAPLSSKQKQDLNKTIEAAIKKKVILQYEEDKNLIGGLVAQVGSFTFNDSLSEHLARIKEDLTRRIN